MNFFSFSSQFSGGIIFHPNGQEQFHLKFEIKSYDERIPLVSSEVRKVRTKLVKQHFRNWALVPAENLMNAKVEVVKDHDGTHYVSNTLFYVPFWLKDEGQSNVTLPKDQLMNYNVENDPNFFEPEPVQDVFNQCVSIFHSAAEHQKVCRREFGVTNELPHQSNQENAMISVNKSVPVPLHDRSIEKNDDGISRFSANVDTGGGKGNSRELADKLKELDVEFSRTPCKSTGNRLPNPTPNISPNAVRRAVSVPMTKQTVSHWPTTGKEVGDASESLNIFSFLHLTTDKPIEDGRIFSSTIIGDQHPPIQFIDLSLDDVNVSPIDNDKQGISQATQPPSSIREPACVRPIVYKNGNQYDGDSFLEHYNGFRQNLYRRDVNLDHQRSKTQFAFNAGEFISNEPFIHNADVPAILTDARAELTSELSNIESRNEVNGSSVNEPIVYAESSNEKEQLTSVGEIENVMSLNDLKGIKKFVDSTLCYWEYKEQMLGRQKHIEKLRMVAVEKSVAAKLNLLSKGVFGNPRLHQIMKQYSMNTATLSEDALLALNSYNFEAKKWTDERVNKMPEANNGTVNAFQLFARNGLTVEHFIKRDFEQYETMADIQNTELFIAVYEEMKNNI